MPKGREYRPAFARSRGRPSPGDCRSCIFRGAASLLDYSAIERKNCFGTVQKWTGQIQTANRVKRVQLPERLHGSSGGHEDLRRPRVIGDKVCDVVDAIFVRDPDALLGAVVSRHLFSRVF